jgi:GT2 family glycosyltransferase
MTPFHRLRPSGLDARVPRNRRARRPDVSVCIVNWNCRALLRNCLRSLRPRRQGVRVEVVVVDNGSADGAADMVAGCFPGVRLVRNAANGGFARANNQAAALARGRYLFFLNNDTVVPPGTLARLYDYAEAHPDVGMVGPRLRGADGRYQASYRPRPTLWVLLHKVTLVRLTGLCRTAYRRYRREAFDPTQPRRVETLMGAALFLRREVFQQCGPWDEDFPFGSEDLRFSDCVARHYPLVFWPGAEVLHYGGVSTRRHLVYATTAQARGHACYLRKSGYSRAALFAYKALVTLDLPVQFVIKGAQYLTRRLRRQPRKLEKSRLAWHATSHFLTRGLVQFWKA